MTTRKSAPLPLLSRKAILEHDDRVRELVDVPEWEGSVYVRSMTGTERDQYEASMFRFGRTARGLEAKEVELGNLRAHLASLTMVDEDWMNLFTPADVLILGQKSAAALERVSKVAQRLSGLTETDVKELMGELGKDPSDGSGSD